VIVLFFACHAKKRTKRKITTDTNPQLALSHNPTLTKSSQSQVRTIRGRLPTGQECQYLDLPHAQHHYYALDAKRKMKIPIRQRTV
jgi:hypothetical protein